MKGAILLVAAMLALSIPSVSGYSFDGGTLPSGSVGMELNSGLSSGDLIAIDIVANGIPESGGMSIYLDFNGSIMRWEGSSTNDPDGYEKGNFYNSQPMYMINNHIFPGDVVDENRLIIGAMNNVGTSQGSGTVMTVIFRLVGTGSTGIGFSRGVLLGNSGGQPMWINATLDTEEAEPIEVEQDDPPEVSLDSPDSGSTFDSGDVIIGCSASDDIELKGLDLLLNDGYHVIRYEKTDVPDTFFATAFELTGLANGVYTWNCEAEDIAGHVSQASQSYQFTVSKPSDTTPPVRSNGQPGGSITDPVPDISLQTSEVAECRYSTMPGTSFVLMNMTFNNTGGTYHYADASVSVINGIYNTSGGNYHFYVRCEDGTGNANQDDYEIAFTVNGMPSDNEPPQILSASPLGDEMPSGTRSVRIEVSTEEISECRYSSLPNQAFDSMEQFTETFSTNHSQTLMEIIDGRSYAFYVKCRDMEGNTNVNDRLISFTINNAPPTEDASPPSIAWIFPDSDVTWNKTLNLTLMTDENADCRFSGSSGVAYDSMSLISFKLDNKSWMELDDSTEGTDNHYYFRCRDETGNMNTETTVSFYVCYESDTDCSKSIDMTELEAYISRWYYSTQDVSIERLMKNIRKWKSG